MGISPRPPQGPCANRRRFYEPSQAPAIIAIAIAHAAFQTPTREIGTNEHKTEVDSPERTGFNTDR